MLVPKSVIRFPPSIPFLLINMRISYNFCAIGHETHLHIYKYSLSWNTCLTLKEFHKFHLYFKGRKRVFFRFAFQNPFFLISSFSSLLLVQEIVICGKEKYNVNGISLLRRCACFTFFYSLAPESTEIDCVSIFDEQADRIGF